MSILKNLEPKAVFSYFEDICSIPHGSGNTKAISDYCVNFAKKHGLWCRQDDSGNVIIKKPASKGRENDRGIILQGHLDMVAVKEPDSEHDFTTDPLDLKIDYENGFVYAKGTSLGGDDGIAVAYALALLADDTINIPRLEAVFTVDEEIGLLGAAALDMSDIEGSYLLNIDSEEEGTLLVSCAGGLTGEITLPVVRKSSSGIVVRICVDGLLGGHSGTEIGKERCNAIQLTGRILRDLRKQISDFEIISLNGGEKDNAIAKYCEIVLLLHDENVQKCANVIDNLEKIYLNEYVASDPGLKLTFDIRQTSENLMCISGESLSKIIFLLGHLPFGVMHRLPELDGLVETSVNIGIVELSENSDKLKITVSIRSSVYTRKIELSENVGSLVEFLGGTYKTHGDYPAWPYKSDSKLRTQMVEIYERIFGNKLKTEAIHAGLECGILLEKKPELDAVSFGPDIFDIHTVKERLSIESVERVWRYLVAVIENIM